MTGVQTCALPIWRIIVLLKGEIVFDGSIGRFKQEYQKEASMDIEDMVRSLYEAEQNQERHG